MSRLLQGFVSLVASARLHNEPDRVAELLASGKVPWADGLVARAPAADLRRYLIDLRLRLGGDAVAVTTFRKAAYLDVGVPHRTQDAWEVDISWRAATAAPLFPVFSGRLMIGPSALRIEGLYAPPGGVIGRAADRVLLHVAANATARWLLTEIDRAALGAAA